MLNFLVKIISWIKSSTKIKHTIIIISVTSFNMAEECELSMCIAATMSAKERCAKD